MVDHAAGWSHPGNDHLRGPQLCRSTTVTEPAVDQLSAADWRIEVRQRFSELYRVVWSATLCRLACLAIIRLNIVEVSHHLLQSLLNHPLHLVPKARDSRVRPGIRTTQAPGCQLLPLCLWFILNDALWWLVINEQVRVNYHCLITGYWWVHWTSLEKGNGWLPLNQLSLMKANGRWLRCKKWLMMVTLVVNDCQWSIMVYDDNLGFKMVDFDIQW